MNAIIPVESFIVSRRQAKADGLTCYFTGIPCQNGHVAERYVSSCDCKICHATKTREYGRKNIVKIVNRFKERVYGITPAEFSVKLWLQNNKCSLCGEDFKSKDVPHQGPHLDHCHKTGKIRDILCRKCNTGLGLFKDDIELLAKAINYIRKHQDGLG